MLPLYWRLLAEGSAGAAHPRGHAADHGGGIRLSQFEAGGISRKPLQLGIHAPGNRGIKGAGDGGVQSGDRRKAGREGGDGEDACDEPPAEDGFSEPSGTCRQGKASGADH